ncbi:AbiH family protein [Massilimicrobiota sp. An134]|uniref:AbiH family protein n=1 Tax=Massilimicrobiota sp. An134 TaxID=1965557 RepID=UPI0013023F7B|nr:AbiH family protein [Massilimicrobiota sp. An134]
MIGNGFDMAHGLYTKYIDFYNFCMVFHNKDVEDIDGSFRKRIYHEFIDCGFKKSAVNVILKENIIRDELLRKMIDICKNNYWLNCIQNRQSLKDPHWCDIEGIIAQEIAKIVYISKHYKNRRMSSIERQEENNEIVDMFFYIVNHSKKDSLRLAIGEIKDKLLLDLHDLTWLLGCYLSKFLNHTKTKRI